MTEEEINVYQGCDGCGTRLTRNEIELRQENKIRFEETQKRQQEDEEE